MNRPDSTCGVRGRWLSHRILLATLLAAAALAARAQAAVLTVSDGLLLRLDGSDDFLANVADSAWNSSTGQWTFFLVNKPDVATGSPNLLRSGYDDINPGMAGNQPDDIAWGSFLSPNGYYAHSRTTTGSFTGNPSSTDYVTDGRWHAQAGLIQATVAPSVAQWIDGVPAGSADTLTTIGMTGHRRTTIGASSNATTGEFFNGQIAEMLVYRKALSAADRISVQDYLYEKYLMPPQPGRDLPLASNLRLHATLDAGQVSGTTAGAKVYDTAGTATPRDGTIVGTLGNPAGKLGEALSFSGSDANYVDFGNVLDPGTHSYAVSLWFNADTLSPSTQFLASKDNSFSADPGWSIWLGGSTLYLHGNHDGAATATRFQITKSNIDAGNWHHVVMVLDRDEEKLFGYLDGLSFGSAALSPGLAISNAYPIYLGRRRTDGAPFSGLIDDFAIWDRALSLCEVEYLYAKGLQGFNAATIPEPSTCVLLGLGLAGVLVTGRARTLLVAALIATIPAGRCFADSPAKSDGAAVFEIQDLFQNVRIPKIVVATDGSVLAFAKSGNLLRRSNDGGRSFSPVEEIGEDASGSVIVDDNTGDVMVVCARGGYLWRSRDQGKSWQRETITIKANALGHGAPDCGVPAETVCSESGVTLRYGKHKGRLLMPARCQPPKGNNDQQWWPCAYNTAIYSDDGGKTWQTSMPVQSGTGEGTLAELSDGRIYYNSRSHMSVDHRRQIAFSHDGGAMFVDWRVCEDLREVGEPFYFKYGTKPSYGCNAGLVRLPLEATGGKDVLLFSTPDNPGGSRIRMTVWASLDGGDRWPVKRLVYEGPSAYSSLAAGSDGTVYLLFERGEKKLYESIAVVRFNLAWLTEGRNRPKL